MDDREDIISDFPGIENTSFELTSASTAQYNCIAWALGTKTGWYWPNKGNLWPAGAKRVESIEAFVEVFRLYEYEMCDDSRLEEGIEKVAIFAFDGIPTHAAWQAQNGRWSSKMGNLADIEHELLDIQNRGGYGQVAVVLKRRRRNILRPNERASSLIS